MDNRAIPIAFVGVLGLLAVLDLNEHGRNRDANLKKEHLQLSRHCNIDFGNAAGDRLQAGSTVLE